MDRLDFDPIRVLSRPLMAHLASVCDEGPRDSPLWFLYEEKRIWLFGTERDSFIRRLQNEPRCALSIVDFDLEGGLLLHVGIRGRAVLSSVDKGRLDRFVRKYLGDPLGWSSRFVKEIVEPIDAMVCVEPLSVVAKDVSVF